MILYNYGAILITMAMSTGDGNNTFGVAVLMFFVITIDWVTLVSSSRATLVGVERFGEPSGSITRENATSSRTERRVMRDVELSRPSVRRELIMKKAIKRDTMVMFESSTHGIGRGCSNVETSKHSGPSPGVGHRYDSLEKTNRSVRFGPNQTNIDSNFAGSLL